MGEKNKKYEIYANKKLLGIIDVNWPIVKKVIAYSITGVITATSITGCSFSTEKIESGVIRELSYNSMDDEIYKKQYFVDSFIEEFRDKQPQLIINRLIELYADFNKLADSIDPANDYSLFLTEEEVDAKKESMISYLDKMILLIQKHTGYRYSEDYIPYAKSK